MCDDYVSSIDVSHQWWWEQATNSSLPVYVRGVSWRMENVPWWSFCPHSSQTCCRAGWVCSISYQGNANRSIRTICLSLIDQSKHFSLTYCFIHFMAFIYLTSIPSYTISNVENGYGSGRKPDHRTGIQTPASPWCRVSLLSPWFSYGFGTKVQQLWNATFELSELLQPANLYALISLHWTDHAPRSPTCCPHTAQVAALQGSSLNNVTVMNVRPDSYPSTGFLRSIHLLSVKPPFESEGGLC